MAEGHTHADFGRMLRSTIKNSHTIIAGGLLEIVGEIAIGLPTSKCQHKLFYVIVYPALIFAAKCGDIQCCDILLRYRCPSFENKFRGQSDNDGLLFAAAADNRVPVLHVLLEKCEEVDVTDLRGMSLLHNALGLRPKKDISATLLARGASLMPMHNPDPTWSGMNLAALLSDKDLGGDHTIFCLTHEENSDATIFATSRSMLALMSGAGKTTFNKIFVAGFDLNPVVAEGGTRIRLTQWAIKHGKLALLRALLHCGVPVDQEVKQDCRRVLRCFGWDPADFRQRILPEKRLLDNEIEARLLRYGRYSPNMKSFYWGAYWYKGQRRAMKNLRVLTDIPKLWHAEPGDDDFPSPVDEEFPPSKVISRTPDEEKKEDLQEGGFLGRGSLLVDTLDSTEGLAENSDIPAITKDGASRSKNVLESGEIHPSRPIQFHIIASYDNWF